MQLSAENYYVSVSYGNDNNDGAKIPSGIYFYHIKTNEFIKTKKMILLK